MAVAKHASVEERELKDNRSQLFPENVHRVEELLQVGVAVSQNFFMGDDLGHFGGEDEAFGSSRRPVADGARRGASIEGRIHLDGMEVLGIERQVVSVMLGPT
jgi:hypothetical protein